MRRVIILVIICALLPGCAVVGPIVHVATGVIRIGLYGLVPRRPVPEVVWCEFCKHAYAVGAKHECETDED